MKQNSRFFLVTFILGIVILVFWPMQFVFYQQDEWKALGSYIVADSVLDLFRNTNFSKIILADGRVFSALVGYLLLGKFPFSTTPLFIYSLGLHLVNTILVYVLAQKFIKHTFFSAIAATFFGICTVSVGAVTWYSTSIGTLPSTTLILLSLIVFLKALEKGKRRNYLISFFLLYISQFFKEIGYFFFLVFPVYALIYNKTTLKHFLIRYWYFLVVFIIITLFRFIELSSYSVESVVFATDRTNYFFVTVLFRALFYPLTALSLIYIPSELFIRIAKFFTNAYYPFFPTEHYNLIVQSVVGDLLAVLLSVTLLSAIFLLAKDRVTLKKFIVLIIFSIATYLPYVILSKDYTYLDSRYYYLGAVPAGIIVGLLLLKIRDNLGGIIYKFILLIILGYFFFLGNTTRAEIDKLAQLSQERVKILKQLSLLKPKLEEKTIFYFAGDRNYYLTQGNHLPFQQGIGYTMLVWYAQHDNRLKGFLHDERLWDLGSQGYFERNKIEFGYFQDKEMFVKTIKDKGLTKAEISAFYYNSKTGELRNISHEFDLNGN